MKLSKQEEIQLIKSLQSHITDDDFKQLVTPYINYCFVIINRLINNKTISEDIVQETLIKVLKNITTFRLESSFKTWISKISYNEALQYLRKHKQKYEFSFEDVEEIHEDTFNLEESVFTSFENEKLWEHVDQLQENHKIVLLFFYKDQLSMKEIATILGCKENNVKVILYRARAELKKRLEKNV